MDKNFFIKTRKNYFNLIEDGSVTILFSGRDTVRSADQDYPFEVNKNFYYLTGINQANVILMLVKGTNGLKEYLFIERNDEVLSKWMGMKLTKEEAQAISGIDKINYLEDFDDNLFSILNSTRKTFEQIDKIYLDLEMKQRKGYSTQALEFYQEILRDHYPHIQVVNAYQKIISLRMIKAPEEVEKIKESIAVTKLALDNILRNIKPELYEYQVETFFDSVIKYNGNREKSFETICATGKNATILHYVDNNTVVGEDDVVLFDLGCRTDFYCSDISRTYPANKKYNKRQKQIYEIVLEANKKCIEYIKPGLTWDQFNDYAKSILSSGLKKLGLINEDNELSEYYYHTVGHMLGLDTHDPVLRNVAFKEGMVITVEPGLYIAQEGIGVRIEDNVLITKDGAINLSADIIKEINDIEKFMNEN